MSQGWMAQARCRDLAPALFFPTNGAGVAAARRVCASCEVAEECLEYALGEHLDHGIWGGTSERERHRILRSRRVQGTAAQGAQRTIGRWLPLTRR
jgi:WhiB family transcriptional regulator, redox-sensing transcriptional regulator